MNIKPLATIPFGKSYECSKALTNKLWSLPQRAQCAILHDKTKDDAFTHPHSENQWDGAIIDGHWMLVTSTPTGHGEVDPTFEKFSAIKSKYDHKPRDTTFIVKVLRLLIPEKPTELN